MNYVDLIEKTLRECFEPDLLEVLDESELHRGHAGFKEGKQTHFAVVISAKTFEVSVIIGDPPTWKKLITLALFQVWGSSW